MQKTLLRTGNYLLSTIVALALIAVIIFFMVPRLLGWQIVVVLSGSMEPTLPVGSVAFVEPRTALEMKPGDILTFRLPEEFGGKQQDKIVQVTHRILEVVQREGLIGFRTQGDANNAPDEYIVPAENVVGEVRYQIPYAGLIADKLRTRQGFLILIAVPGTLIIAGELRTIFREVKNLRSKKKLDQEAKA